MLSCRSRLDDKAQKALSSKSLKIYFSLMIIGAIGLIVYLILYITKLPNIDWLLVFVIPFVVGLIYFIAVNLNIRKAKNTNYLNVYEFYEYYFIVYTYQGKDKIATNKMYYNELHKVVDAKEYIFIYIKIKQAFIIKKTDIKDPELLTLIQNLINNK